ncbi:MAG: Smr/MutS family protein [Acidobacteriota bacterium]
MPSKQFAVRGSINQLAEIVQKAGILLESPVKKPVPSHRSKPVAQPAVSRNPNKHSDEEIFLKAMAGVERLSWNRKSRAQPKPNYENKRDPAEKNFALMQAALEERNPIPLSEHPEYIEGWINVTGRRYLPNLRNGLYSIQGQLDLHGMIREEARTAVQDYIIRMSRFRSCCIKIIHGRGINSPLNRSTLKDNLPQLLSTRKMSRYVVAYSSSSQLDGGVGSIYVLLKSRPY